MEKESPSSDIKLKDPWGEMTRALNDGSFEVRVDRHSSWLAHLATNRVESWQVIPSAVSRAIFINHLQMKRYIGELDRRAAEMQKRLLVLCLVSAATGVLSVAIMIFTAWPK